MKRKARAIGTGALLLLAVVAVAIWYAAFRAPSMDRAALPPDLISIDSSLGKQLLSRSGFTADYDALLRNFEAQMRPAYCGVASSVVVLNALEDREPHLTQSSFFGAAASTVKTSLETTFGGMTISELADLLRAHGAEATIHAAADSGLEEFRAIAEDNLKTPGDFIIVNYQRGVLGQKAMGHISPIAAYDAVSDRMLVLDVAAYRYPPVWVSTATLWDAMNTIDTTSGRTRGFVVVKRSAASTAR